MTPHIRGFYAKGPSMHSGMMVLVAVTDDLAKG